jgi:phage shock protein PspC (stress-responsive transcriptional regulator)
MSIADELEKLSSLHARGVLSDAEFQQLKQRLLQEPDEARALLVPVANTPLRRSSSQRWLGGVCGGIASLVGVEPWLVRLIFTAMVLLWGTGIVIYLLLWAFVPNE